MSIADCIFNDQVVHILHMKLSEWSDGVQSDTLTAKWCELRSTFKMISSTSHSHCISDIPFGRME